MEFTLLNFLVSFSSAFAIFVTAVMSRALLRGRRLEQARLERMITALDNAHEEQNETEHLKRRKMNALRERGPKTFFYLNETIVNDLYPQIASVVRADTIEAVDTGAFEATVGAELYAVKGGLGKKRTRETRTKYTVEPHVPSMYNQLEDYLVGHGMCSIILDEYAGGEAAVCDLSELGQLMKDRFHYEIPDDLQLQYLADSKSEAANKALAEMATYSGYVIIQAQAYQSRHDEATITLRYEHPANSDLKPDDKGLLIDLICDGSHLRDNGRQAFSRTDAAKVIAFGKIIGLDNAGRSRTLIVDPIAIY